MVQFIQVLVEADLRDPVHLRRLREAGRGGSRALDNVARVQHVGQPVALLNEMMEGQPRLPDNWAKVETLFGFLTGNPAVRQLANEERTRALMHVTVGTNKADDIDVLLDQVQALVNDDWFQRFKVVDVTEETRSAVDEDHDLRMQRVLKQARFERTSEAIKNALMDRAQARIGSIQAAIVKHLMSAEALVAVESAQAVALADALVALGPEPSTARSGRSGGGRRQACPSKMPPWRTSG